MKYIRLLLVSFVVLLLFITAISFLIPSHIKISRAINIRADKTVVMAEIHDAFNWRKWYPGLDSASVIYDGEMAKAWILNKKSQAKIEMKSASEDEVTADFTGGKTKPVINTWRIIGSPSADSVTVHWYMDFHLRWYPWEKFASLLLEKSYGPKMEQGLTTLKELVEN
jgi:Polyketide cyclase / dehydrase and lipid transport